MRFGVLYRPANKLLPSIRFSNCGYHKYRSTYGNSSAGIHWPSRPGIVSYRNSREEESSRHRNRNSETGNGKTEKILLGNYTMNFLTFLDDFIFFRENRWKGKFENEMESPLKMFPPSYFPSFSRYRARHVYGGAFIEKIHRWNIEGTLTGGKSCSSRKLISTEPEFKLDRRNESFKKSFHRLNSLESGKWDEDHRPFEPSMLHKYILNSD